MRDEAWARMMGEVDGWVKRGRDGEMERDAMGGGLMGNKLE